MSHDMPKEIWAIDNAGFENCKIWEDEQIWHDEHCTQYTLTSHHTAEIAKRDRAIEKLLKLNIFDQYGGEMSNELITAISEAQAILNGGQDE